MPNQSNKNRIDKIVELRKEKKTLNEIGRALGISRARVWQIGESIHGFKNLIPKKVKPVIICLECGADKKVSDKEFATARFCSLDCRKIWYEVNHKVNAYCYSHPQCKERFRLYNNERFNSYYHRVLKYSPEFIKKRNYRNNAKGKEYVKKYYNSEKGKLHRKIYLQKKWLKIKSDPIKHEEYLAKQRLRYKKYDLKKRNEIGTLLGNNKS